MYYTLCSSTTVGMSIKRNAHRYLVCASCPLIELSEILTLFSFSSVLCLDVTCTYSRIKQVTRQSRKASATKQKNTRPTYLKQEERVCRCFTGRKNFTDVLLVAFFFVLRQDAFSAFRFTCVAHYVRLPDAKK